MRTMGLMRRQRGTTIIVVLAVLLVLGIMALLFTRIVASTAAGALVGSDRSRATGLAQDGVRYAFAQLRFSEDGADWRPSPPIDQTDGLPGLGPNYDPEDPAATNPDPDYYWLRRQMIVGNPDPNDRGGPDGLGYYTRLNFDRGRALVRVRFSPSDASLFADPNRAVALAGKLRSYTIVEAVGRPTVFNPLDPTSSRQPHLQNARMLSAIVPIGIIESARYVTNIDKRSTPIELGSPIDFGSNFLGAPVRVPMIVGGEQLPAPPSYPGGLIRVGGSMYINGSLRIPGNAFQNSGLNVTLNDDLGDQINVYGEIQFSESTSALFVTRVSAVGGFETNFSQFMLQSSDPNFTTFRGAVKDIADNADPDGYPRATVYKDPPLMDEADPNTGELRYRSVTRTSGQVATDSFGGHFNLGRLGYGRGVYLDNARDLRGDSEDGDFTRRFDWTHPNNGHSSSFWRGPYYIPKATAIFLQRDGFTISRFRHGQNDNRSIWRDYQNNVLPNSKASMRFKLGLGTDNRVHIINEVTPGVTNFGSPSPADYDQGPEFNGVIFGEGDLKIRGVIPNGIQMTIVTMGDAYIEGSILKGNGRSSIAVLARDNVVLNTTQILHASQAASGNDLDITQDANDPNSPHRVRVSSNNPLALSAQFPINPRTGNSHLSEYTYTNPSRDSSQPPIQPSLFIAHAAQFNAQSYFNLLINQFSIPNPSFLFENINPPNAASLIYGGVNPIPTYGLADPNWQVLPRYEKRRFEFWPITGVNGNGQYNLFLDGTENSFLLKKDNTIAPPGGNADYFVSRAALAPQDVRIEAVLYAQNGSFFVIPGLWFNHDPNDRRDAFTNALDRFNAFGANVEFPFYAEPIDVKITIIGGVSENLPPQQADQNAWLQRWGWIPSQYGASEQYIPDQHYARDSGGNPIFTTDYAPNLSISYDPLLITGRVGGSMDYTDPLAPPLRTDAYGRSLPPMPKLPVSTRIFYFGEVNP